MCGLASFLAALVNMRNGGIGLVGNIALLLESLGTLMGVYVHVFILHIGSHRMFRHPIWCGNRCMIGCWTDHSDQVHSVAGILVYSSIHLYRYQRCDCFWCVLFSELSFDFFFH